MLNYEKFKQMLVPLVEEIPVLASTDIHRMLNDSDDYKKYREQTVLYLYAMQQERLLSLEETRHGIDYFLIKKLVELGH